MNRSKENENRQCSYASGRRRNFNGDIELKGQLIVAGNVNGAIKADEETSVVTVAETGCIKGELIAPIIEIFRNRFQILRLLKSCV